MAIRIQLRGDTAANWTAANPVLAVREEGIETDTFKRKIGDGVTPWSGLPYNSSATADIANALAAEVARANGAYDTAGAATSAQVAAKAYTDTLAASLPGAYASKPTGTPTTGQVPTAQSDGSTAWATPTASDATARAQASAAVGLAIVLGA